MADSQSEIKLVITGQHESAATSLEQVSKLIADVQESVAKLISQLGEAATTFAEFGRGVAQIADSLSSVSRRINSFGKNMDTQAKAVSDGSQSIVKSMDEINQAVERTTSTDSTLLRQFADAQNAVAVSAYEATQKITAETAQMRAQADLTKANTSSAKQTQHETMLAAIGVQMVGQQVTDVGKKGVDLFTGAIGSAIDFQASMDRVKAALMSTGGASQDNINKLGQVAQKLDQTTIFSANDISDAMQSLAKQGITFGDLYGDGIHNAISATTTLAQATDTDLSKTSTIIGDVMNEFALKGKDMTSAVNSISGSMHVSKISMDDFYNAMKYAGPSAHSLGMNVTDVSQAIGLLAERGIKGTQAGTTLRRMFMNLEPHTKAATDEFKKLGLITKDGSNQFFDATGHIKSMGDVVQILKSHLAGLTPVQQQQALTTMFGAYALSGMTVIASTTDAQWNKLTKSMADTNAQDVAAEKINNVKGHIKILESTVQTLGMQMATFLLPAIDKIVTGLTHLANWFQNLNPHTQHLIFIVLGLVSAFVMLTGMVMTAAATLTFIQPGLQMIGSAFTSIGTRMMGLLGPWGIVIAAVIAGVVLLIQHWTQINDWLQQHFGVTIPGILNGLLKVFEAVWNGIKAVITAVWDFISPYIIGGVNKVASYWKSIWPELRDLFGEVWNVIKVILYPIIEWMKLTISADLAIIKATWKDAWNMIKDVLKAIWDVITGIIKTAWDVISGIFKIILDVLTGRWKDAWNDMKDLVKNVWKDITSLFSNFVQDAFDFGQNFVKMIGDGIMAGVHWVEQAATNVINKVKGLLGFHSPTEEGPGSEADKWAPNFVNMYADGLKQNVPKIQSALTVALQTPFTNVNNQLATGNISGRINQSPSYGGLGGVSSGQIVNFNAPVTITTQAKDGRGLMRELKQQHQLNIRG